MALLRAFLFFPICYLVVTLIKWLDGDPTNEIIEKYKKMSPEERAKKDKQYQELKEDLEKWIMD